MDPELAHVSRVVAAAAAAAPVVWYLAENSVSYAKTYLTAKFLREAGRSSAEIQNYGYSSDPSSPLFIPVPFFRNFTALGRALGLATYRAING